MAPDCRVGDTETFAQRECLGEVARGHLHLVAVLTQALDHRPHHEHVRAVRQINPNAHLKRDGIVAQRMLVLASVTESLVNDTSHFVRDAGLPGIFALMAIGSACIPIPSEVVMLFAGFAVADPGQSASHHHLTILGIVLAGLLGTMVGSWITYAIGRGGRLELLERHGSKLHMGPAQIGRAEHWFERFGQPVVFFGRMVPLIRAFVSLPAGVARMPFWRFTVLSLLGSLPWVLALALVGHALGGNWTSVRKDFQYVDYAILALILAGIVYAIVRRRHGGATSASSDAAPDSDAAADAG
jgi:membrane protein DedA with SNARE-associated domain